MADGNGFVIAAYAAMWIGLIGYALKLHRVSREAERRLDEALREGRERNA